jgi:hypothetical protein
MFRRIKTKDSSKPAKDTLTFACILTLQFFLTQKALPVPITPKQYSNVSKQSISITENNLTGTVPSVTAKPPLRVERRRIRGKETPGERDGVGAETDNDSAAAKISSRTESDEEDMTGRGGRQKKEQKRKIN